MLIGVSGKINSGKDLVGKIIQYHLYMTKEVRGRYYPPDVFIEELATVDLSKVSGVEIKKFADKLKDIVCLLIGCTREQLENQKFKETELGEEWNQPKEYVCKNLDKENCSFCECKQVPLTPRKLLQLIGTQCGRQIIHPDIWVNATMGDYTPNEGYEYKVKPTGNIGFGGQIEMTILSNPERYNNGYHNWIITDCRFPNEAKAIKDRNGITIRVNRPNIFDAAIKSLAIEHESETALDDYKFDYVIENNGTIEDLIIKVKEILIKEEIL